MTRACLCGLAVLLLASAAAVAQPVAPGGAASRPTFSPYLNLLRGNTSPALNYYGLVRPQQQFQQQANQFQAQLNQFNQANQQYADQMTLELNQLSNYLLPATGNVATFNNTQGYFNRSGGGGYGSAGFGGSGGSAANVMKPSFTGGRQPAARGASGVPARR